jgi:phosphoribosylglycinamide formyltransferase 1
MTTLAHEPSRTKTSRGIVPPSDVLFITEASPWGKLGYQTTATAFASPQPLYWSPGMPKPDLSAWHGDWIICFKADLILARTTLDRAKRGAINFHPSPPKYRGLGGYWWALNNGDQVFGVTVHHMDKKIDHGDIIKTNAFPIWPGDTAESLKHRAAIHALMLLNETLDAIVSGRPLVPNGAEWERHLYTAKELEQAQHTQMERSLAAVQATRKETAGLRQGQVGAVRTDRAANSRR